MPIHELAALAAALTWAFTGIISANPSRTLGALAFNRLRMSIVFVALIAWAWSAGTLQTVAGPYLLPLALSGLIGIFLGDTALFLTMNRLGPRRTAILFSTNAPMSVMLGWFLLGEDVSPTGLLGIAIAFCGVILAIVFGKRRDQLHKWEEVTGPLWIGVALGLAAGLAQAAGALISRPVMETGLVDPVAASAVRVGVAALCLALVGLLPFQALRARAALSANLVFWVALSGILGMGVGMTLILYALEGAKVGIITTLSATTPAMMLPLLWWQTRQVPAAGAWIGAALVIIGSALIFNR